MDLPQRPWSLWGQKYESDWDPWVFAGFASPRFWLPRWRRTELEKPKSPTSPTDFFWIDFLGNYLKSNWFRMLDTFWKLMFGQFSENFHGFEMFWGIDIHCETKRSHAMTSYDLSYGGPLQPFRLRWSAGTGIANLGLEWHWLIGRYWELVGAGTLVPSGTIWLRQNMFKHGDGPKMAKISNQGDHRFWSIFSRKPSQYEGYPMFFQIPIWIIWAQP